MLPARGVCQPPRRPLNTTALRAASGLTCRISFLLKEGQGGRPRSLRKGSARFFGVEWQNTLKPKFLPGPRGPFPRPFCGGTLGASRSFFHLSKELHSDSDTEVPLCTLSRHPLGVYTWDLLRFSSYQQHPKPNCYGSCRVLTPAVPCEVLAFLEGQAFWEPFLEAVLGALAGPFLVACVFPGPHWSCSKEPNGVSLIIPSRVQLRAAATRETLGTSAALNI